MNNNQLNGLFTDFRQFNPYFCCFEPSNSWGFGVLVEISLFPVPCSLLPVPCSLFPVPCSLFPVPCSLSPVPCSLFPVASK